MELTEHRSERKMQFEHCFVPSLPCCLVPRLKSQFRWDEEKNITSPFFFCHNPSLLLSSPRCQAAAQVMVQLERFPTSGMFELKEYRKYKCPYEDRHTPKAALGFGHLCVLLSRQIMCLPTCTKPSTCPFPVNIAVQQDFIP